MRTFDGIRWGVALGGALVVFLAGPRAHGQGLLGPVPAAERQALQEAADREAAQKAELAAAILSLRESAAGRPLDAGYRAWLQRDLTRLSVAQLESLRDARGEGDLRALAGAGPTPNALGDTDNDLVFTPVAPCRILDTRLSSGGMLVPGSRQTFETTGASTDFSSQGGSATGCGVPTGATAVAVNFGATQSAGPGNVRAYAWAPMVTAPNAAVLNFGNLAPVGLVTMPNGSIVPICDPVAVMCSSDMYIEAFNSATHLVADVTGYFSRADASVLTRAVSNRVGINYTTSPQTGTALAGITAPTRGGLLVNLHFSCASFSGTTNTEWSIVGKIDGAATSQSTLIVLFFPHAAASLVGDSASVSWFQPVLAGTHTIGFTADRLAGDGSLDCEVLTASHFVPFNNAGGTP